MKNVSQDLLDRLLLDRLPRVESSRSSTLSFDIHGLSVNVVSDSAFMLGAVREMLMYFLLPEKRPSAEVRFHLLESSLDAGLVQKIRDRGDLLYDSKEGDELGILRETEVTLKYFFYEGAYVADFGANGIFLLDLQGGKGTGFFPNPSALHPGFFSNFFFLIGFSEILRSKELFLIHSGALAWKGQGVLIPGFTGSGKTTLTLALGREGFRFLSDDRPLIREIREGEIVTGETDGGFEILAFPEEVDVTEETLALFPEMSRLPDGFFKRGPRKKRFWFEKVYPGSILNACRPRVLVFPKIVDQEKSRLKPISRTEAVERLLPHTLLVFEESIARRQFHLLCRLMEKMDCYRLYFGKDVLDVHRQIKEVME